MLDEHKERQELLRVAEMVITKEAESVGGPRSSRSELHGAEPLGMII